MRIMKIQPFGRVVGIVALKNYLALDCELKQIDLGRGDQRAPALAFWESAHWDGRPNLSPIYGAMPSHPLTSIPTGAQGQLVPRRQLKLGRQLLQRAYKVRRDGDTQLLGTCRQCSK